jgi:hypothetical protein
MKLHWPDLTFDPINLWNAPYISFRKNKMDKTIELLLKAADKEGIKYEYDGTDYWMEQHWFPLSSPRDSMNLVTKYKLNIQYTKDYVYISDSHNVLCCEPLLTDAAEATRLAIVIAVSKL